MRWVWLLWLLMLASALTQILVSHQQRQLLKEWHAHDEKRIQLQQEYSMLLLERGTLSAHNRLDRLARQKLGMTESTEVQVLKP